MTTTRAIATPVTRYPSPSTVVTVDPDLIDYVLRHISAELVTTIAVPRQPNHGEPQQSIVIWHRKGQWGVHSARISLLDEEPRWVLAHGDYNLPDYPTALQLALRRLPRHAKDPSGDRYYVPCEGCGITLDVVAEGEPQLCVECEPAEVTA